MVARGGLPGIFIYRVKLTDLEAHECTRDGGQSLCKPNAAFAVTVQPVRAPSGTQPLASSGEPAGGRSCDQWPSCKLQFPTAACLLSYIWDPNPNAHAQLAMAFSLLPFGFVWIVNPASWIGYVVLVNGVVYHVGAAVGFRLVWLAYLWDLLCNVCLCVYVNVATHWQPWTVILTLLSGVSWALKSYVREFGYLVHIVFVQWILCLLLYVFESR